MSQPPDEAQGGRSGKILNDPIHGHVYLDPTCQAIVDTPEFQRLRDLKQLGAAYLVFPGGSHNRFEHSIGVSHLAGTLLSRIRAKQPELGITDHDLLVIRIAGLCHDIGHGPFSHAFEHIVNNLDPTLHWEHENMSMDMLDYLVEKNDILETTALEANDVEIVKALIRGKPKDILPEDKGFLFDIVANSRNGVDVDKFDYLARDCYNLGIKSSYDYLRLFSFCKVIDGEICYYAKEAFNVYQMFHTRYSLHKQVYSHPVGRAIEYMIGDIFHYANSHLGLVEAVKDPARYCRLTDHILRDIEFWEGSDPGMRAARAIVRRLRRRDLYKCVDEIILSPSEAAKFPGGVVPSDVVSHRREDGGYELEADDIIVDYFRLNYSRGTSNPVDSIRFFTHWESQVKIAIPSHKVSYLVPSNFQEVCIRVFSRSPDPAVLSAAQVAFQNWCRHHQTATPVPSRTNSISDVGAVEFGGGEGGSGPSREGVDTPATDEEVESGDALFGPPPTITATTSSGKAVAVNGHGGGGMKRKRSDADDGLDNDDSGTDSVFGEAKRSRLNDGAAGSPSALRSVVASGGSSNSEMDNPSSFP